MIATVALRALLAAGLPAPGALATTLPARMTVASVTAMTSATVVILATVRDLLTAGKPPTLRLSRKLRVSEKEDADTSYIVTATTGRGTTGTTAIAVRTVRMARTASVSIKIA